MREKEIATQVLYVRHGQPDYDGDRIYDDKRMHIGLTELGQQQALSTASHLKDQGITAIYASPILRTRQTAEALAAQTGLEIIDDERLQERDFGIWNGLSFTEIESNFPEEYLQWKRAKLEYQPKNGENMQQVSARLQQFLHEVLPRHQNQKIAVFSHVGPIRLAITLAFQIPMGQFRQFQVDYAGVSQIDYGQTLNNLIYMNKVYY